MYNRIDNLLNLSPIGFTLFQVDACCWRMRAKVLMSVWVVVGVHIASARVSYVFLWILMSQLFFCFNTLVDIATSQH